MGIFGTPGRIWSDNGGEFSSEEMRDLADNLGIEVSTGAAFSPWMNGINERQHHVIDRMLEKMLFENPGMNREVALIWASNAKNSLQMQNGFSSHQLLFGENHQLPKCDN